MKVGIIDIGSNSVRLMLWADGKTLYKRMMTTRLGDGLNFSRTLNAAAIQRTVAAIADFKALAEEGGAEEVFAFATAAVRSSDNPEDFLSVVKAKCGLTVEVLSGETEAAVGLCGALGNSDGGIIDVGGASTEVTARSNGKIIYSHSASVGTVRILDAAGRDMDKIKSFVADKISEYGECNLSGCNMYAVGGTATRLAHIKHDLREYRPDVSNGTVMTAKEIHKLAQMLTQTPVEEIQRNTICTKSADLIGGGAELLASVMDKFGIEKITVSESDNLEGYANYKLSGGGDK
ncbi:MAG: hypothetical protein K2N47_02800 [Clostridia bacterium]|nr:hypothetical protein [Clostridia bacterium]